MEEIYYALPNVDMPITVLYGGREECAAGHRWVGVRDHHLLHHVVSGRGVVWTGGKPIPVQGGGFFLYGPADEQRYQADWTQPWSYQWIGFSGDHAGSLQEIYRRLTSSAVLQSRYRDEVTALFARVITALGLRGPGSPLVASGLLQAIFGLIVSEGPVAPGGAAVAVNYAAAAAEFIDLNFQRSIRVGDVADRVGVDRSYLSRLFRERHGASIRDYLIDRRIGRARELLAETGLSVVAVAASVGYESYSVFERRFRERVGRTPTEWRESASHRI